jgi:hypothetical protein
MGGQPVWLASIGRVDRRNGRRIYVPEWTDRQLLDGVRQLRQVLRGVGNTRRERLFRMNVTLCLHRAATDAEVALQPPWFLTANGCGLAGGPIEILEETEPGTASTKPCAHPRREVIDDTNRYGWIPVDCGTCESCLARAACDVDDDE